MKTAKEEANEALSALIEAVNGDFGAKTELAQKISAETGQEVPRQRIQLWLHPDPEKRVEPMLGMGLLLLRIGLGRKLTKQKQHKKQNAHDEKIPTAPIRRHLPVNGR